ncbi:MAG: thiol:disulfide interchange protein DsbA/DsbL [Gammaproteobacteria bacterium]|nr:thiol:disulfide interchange protein DsbA/DsbL [Gammaproteobacteria bacterium]MDH5511721.1 thiol:disulfide interchange protein DsbA/DsbL [Gammaproteobacteria bacterium]
MKRFFGIWLTALFLLPGLAHAGFEEGRHYMSLPFPATVETGNRIEVREFFWYGCPHCYVLEPSLANWLKKMPANAQFVRTPGTAPRWMLHGQAYYAFEALGALDKLHGAFFKAMQDKPGAFNDEKSIASFAASHGVDGKKFGEVFNSFGVRLKLEKAKQLNQDLNISSVPAMVVDGKYLTTAAMAGGEDAMLKLLDHLISKAAKERRKQPAKK